MGAGCYPILWLAGLLSHVFFGHRKGHRPGEIESWHYWVTLGLVLVVGIGGTFLLAWIFRK